MPRNSCLTETKRYRSRNHARNSIGSLAQARRATFESLDTRCMLTVSFEMVVDINLGAPSSLLDSTDWAELDGFLYFAADDGINGTELWKTDGTSAGTTLVADINQLPPEDPFSFEDSLGSFPLELTVFNNEIYFAATTEVGDELWKTDGTEAGTVLVADINPGEADGVPFHLTEYRGELYFGATTEEFGDELWKTDGTEAGTVMVADIAPEAESSIPTQMYVFEDELYFSAADFPGDVELWKSDGTDEGTQLVADIHPDLLPSFPEAFFEFNSELYFIAADEITPEGVLSSHLYKTDGTAEGTERVTVERLTIGFTDDLPNIVEFNDQLYFGGIDAFGQWELYRTTGTPGESELVTDIGGAFSSSPSDMVVFDGHLYFAANDESGRQLWRTDGGIGEDGVVERLTSVENENIGSFPTELLEFDGELFFNANNGQTYQVWRTAGGELETITDFAFSEISAFTSNFFEFNDRLFFRGAGDDGLELWSLSVEEPLVPPVVDPPAPQLDGDIDGNGKVEFADFLVLSRNFGQEVLGRENGDFDGNGIVDFSDFLKLSQNFGSQVEELFAVEQNWL